MLRANGVDMGDEDDLRYGDVSQPCLNLMMPETPLISANTRVVFLLWTIYTYIALVEAFQSSRVLLQTQVPKPTHLA